MVRRAARQALSWLRDQCPLKVNELPRILLTDRVCLARLLRLADALAAERRSEGWIAILQESAVKCSL